MSIQGRVVNKTYFNGWQVQDYLGGGSGGRTAVFRMERNRGFMEVCALKVVNIIEEDGRWDAMSPQYQAQFERRMQELQARALREVELMYRMRGNSMIVSYLDFQTVRFQDAYSFGCDLLIRMELLQVVRDLQKANYTFSEQDIVRVGKNICTALQACHAIGIVHRDIKPANIFRNQEGLYKLGDFGVSRILEANRGASTTIGTETYAAPEQFLPGYDLRVDIYSLGLTLYELANNNCLPFSSSPFTDNIAIQRRLSGEPLPAPKNVSPALAAVILKACAYKKENRYRTAGEFLHALEQTERQTARSNQSSQLSYDSGVLKRQPNPQAYRSTGTSGQRPNPQTYRSAGTGGKRPNPQTYYGTGTSGQKPHAQTYHSTGPSGQSQNVQPPYNRQNRNVQSPYDNTEGQNYYVLGNPTETQILRRHISEALDRNERIQKQNSSQPLQQNPQPPQQNPTYTLPNDSSDSKKLSLYQKLMMWLR